VRQPGLQGSADRKGREGLGQGRISYLGPLEGGGQQTRDPWGRLLVQDDGEKKSTCMGNAPEKVVLTQEYWLRSVGGVCGGGRGAHGRVHSAEKKENSRNVSGGGENSWKRVKKLTRRGNWSKGAHLEGGTEEKLKRN